MNIMNRYCICGESQFLMRTVSNYGFFLCLGLVLVVSNWFIQNASAQTPSGTLVLVGPEKDPAPNEEFVVSVEILNPQNIYVFNMTIEYPDALSPSLPNDIQPGEGQFDINELSIGTEQGTEDGRVQRFLNLMNNTDNVSEGTLFTIKFETSEIGNLRIGINLALLYSNGLSDELRLDEGDIDSLTVPVRGPIAGTVHLVPSVGTERVGETGFIDIELKNRRRAHSYEITVDPSENLGSLTVSYNADDTNGTAITNHMSGDPITIGADLWLPNDPFIIDEDGSALTDEEIALLADEEIQRAPRDDNDWRLTHSDPIVATVFFTATTAGQGIFEITEAKIFDTDDTELTLSNPDVLTFTIVGASLLPDGNTPQVTAENTGTGPTPIITVRDGVKQGPFEIKIHFESDNYIEHVVNAEASIRVQRGVYGFARDEIEVGGTAGASVTTRLWEADGAEFYYARINPTETGAREVTLQVPASVVNEVGTNLSNVASEIVTVNTNLVNPPWDVDQNGMVQEADAELVEEALGQGMEERGNFALYVSTITDPEEIISDEEYRRRDVNGDLYVNQVDVDLVRAHIPDDGLQGRSAGVSGQAEGTRQAHSIAPPPDASVWMPDENLRREVRKKFGIRSDSELTQARMTHLTSIGFRSDEISNITGLEYAVNLTELVFRNTQISDLEPLRGLTSLEDLKLVDNNITDITPLSGLMNLMFLNISGNNISDLTPLSGLANLTELWATDNNISDVTALASLTQLQKLRLRDNSILDTSPLYLLTQGALQDVDITISQYPPASTWMPDANLRNAVRKALSIGTNENFSQEQVTTLTNLTAEKKRISDIMGLEHATVLKKLDLRRNQISDIRFLEGLTELTELKIGYNNIGDITAFAGLTKLTHVGLAENQINDITALENLTNLIELWLPRNNISDITALENLTHLTHLNLEENEISDITALGNLRNLKELWLWKNNISDITALENLTKLTHLDLKSQEISDITALGNLRNLKELWMAGNNIGDITALGSLTQLTYLNLRDNEIGDITALGSLTKLIELWLQKNNIGDVSPLSSLRKLKQLGLANNPILDTSPLYPLTQRALRRVDVTVSQHPPWDVNEDGVVDATDSSLVTAALGQTGADIADPRTDVNGDGTVDQDDLTLVTDNIGTDGGAPSSVSLFALMDQETLENLDRGVLKEYLNILRAESDGSAKYQRAIAMLERVLAATRPKQTQLLANYPNPFNPETWIPYQLADTSDVKIVIYDTTGKMVKRLDLGHQPEGYYKSRSRAAYWDGRNNLGERLASGLYFYHFQADNISSLRKLLILK